MSKLIKTIDNVKQRLNKSLGTIGQAQYVGPAKNICTDVAERTEN